MIAFDIAMDISVKGTFATKIMLVNKLEGLNDAITPQFFLLSMNKAILSLHKLVSTSN